MSSQLSSNRRHLLAAVCWVSLVLGQVAMREANAQYNSATSAPESNSRILKVAVVDSPASLVRTGGISLDSRSGRSETGGPSAVAGQYENSLDISIDSADHSTAGDNESATSLVGGMGGKLGTTIGALAITLGLFVAVVMVMRRLQAGQKMQGLPREAFEVVGESTIGPRQKLMVVRCGIQALVIGVTPAGIHRVAQIDDPDEAAQFIAQCRGSGATAMFRNTLREMETEPAAAGFVDQTSDTRKSSKLFLRA
jgi:flagellar biogenesis protein FliO